MDTRNANHCIKCSVKNCKNHNETTNYCCLDCVCIGTHESNPQVCQCVDCENFEAKCNCGK